MQAEYSLSTAFFKMSSIGSEKYASAGRWPSSRAPGRSFPAPEGCREQLWGGPAALLLWVGYFWTAQWRRCPARVLWKVCILVKCLLCQNDGNRVNVGHDFLCARLGASLNCVASSRGMKRAKGSQVAFYRFCPPGRKASAQTERVTASRHRLAG